MERYQIYPCADEHQHSIKPDRLVGATDDPVEAKRIAEDNAGMTFGTAILDTVTGLIDYGFGFGRPVPTPEI